MKDETKKAIIGNFKELSSVSNTARGLAAVGTPEVKQATLELLDIITKIAEATKEIITEEM